MYLDPSFGGMLLQILVAVVAGGGAVAFGMRRKIKALFKKNKNNPGISAEPQNTDDEAVIDMLAGGGKDGE